MVDMKPMSGPAAHRTRYVVMIAAILALGACEPEEPESRLKQAAGQVDQAKEKVQSARENVAEAKDELGSLQQAVDEAQQQLAQARKKLRRRQEQLAENRDRLHSFASDTAIFRLLQTRLLDEPSLSTAAVSADVINGRVTLRGEVESTAQKETAGKIAAGTPGVEEVRNLVDVSGDGEKSRG